MIKRIASLILSGFCILTGCTNAENRSMDTGELPAIVFLVRTDISDTLSEADTEEIERQNIAVRTLGFYDKNGSYYISVDPDLNALDNKTLIDEYEAGHLTEQIQYYTSCDADILAEQYEKLRNICLNGEFEIVYPNELPTVQAESSAWYGFYFDQDENLQYQAIHREERMTELYSDNDTVNEIYDWIIETFKAAERSE